MFAGHTITIDGQFQDWDQVPLAYSDPQSSDQMSADFADVKITYDMEFLFIYFNFYGNEFLLQDWNDFHLLLDTDHNGSTGLAIDGIGAELDWTFGSRSGIQYLNGSQYELWQNDISLRVESFHDERPGFCVGVHDERVTQEHDRFGRQGSPAFSLHRDETVESQRCQADGVVGFVLVRCAPVPAADTGVVEPDLIADNQRRVMRVDLSPVPVFLKLAIRKKRRPRGLQFPVPISG